MEYLPGRQPGRQPSQEGRRIGMTRLLLVSILAGALGMVLSCNPVPNMPWGVLTIQVASPEAKLMVPGIDMTTSNYVITGAGPNGAAFSKTTTGGSLSMPGLVYGAWSIAVDGQNAAGTVITHGAATVTVVAGTTQSVSVAVAPIAGPGTLGLTLTWVASSVDIPSIQSQLVPSTGSPIDLAFSITTPGKATYTSSTVMNGYYTLVVKLLDNGQLVMGAVDVVRIVKGQTTTGSVDFTQVNTGTGLISVNITPTMNDPITVTMSGQQAELGVGAPETVTASVPSGLGAATYVWYLNGVSKSTGATFTFNNSSSPLSPGTYRLDVAAFTANGTRGGSATYTFKVFSTSSVTLVWDPSTDPTVTGYKFYWGTASGVYGSSVDVGLVTTYTVTGLLSGHTYYFAVTDYNASKQESTYSNEVTYTAP